MPNAPGRAALIGALITAFVVLPGLNLGTLWDNSETAYGEVAREILLSHDWVVMHFNGAPWFIQPPLYFWIAAIFAKILGVGTLAVRLPSALATIGMGAGIAYAGARALGLRAGIIAAVILSTTWMQAVIGRLAIMDALLDLCVLGSMLWWYRAFAPRPRSTDDAKSRDAAVVWGALAAGLGILTKGPVALALPVLVIGVWAILERYRGTRLGAPRRAALLRALAVLVIVAVPWFAVLAARSGPGGIATLIAHYTIGRYTGVIENQRGPVYYYIPVVILGFFPWTSFLVAALIAAERRVRLDSRVRFLLVWAIVPIVFFSAAQTKLPNYIAIAWPPLALLTAAWFEQIGLQRERRAAMTAALAVPIVIALVAIALRVFVRNGGLGPEVTSFLPQLAAIGVLTIVGGVAAAALVYVRRAGFAAPAFGAAAVAVLLVIALVAIPRAEAYKPIPALARTIDRRLHPGDVVAIVAAVGDNSLMFYTRPHVFPLSEVNGVLDSNATRLLCFSPRAFVVTQRAARNRIPTVGRHRSVIAHANKDILFLYDGPPCERREVLR